MRPTSNLLYSWKILMNHLQYTMSACCSETEQYKWESRIRSWDPLLFQHLLAEALIDWRTGQRSSLIASLQNLKSTVKSKHERESFFIFNFVNNFLQLWSGKKWPGPVYWPGRKLVTGNWLLLKWLSECTLEDLMEKHSYHWLFLNICASTISWLYIKR